MQSIKSTSTITNIFSCTSLGTPGPYNKQSVLLITAGGDPVSITKVGANLDTHKLLSNEALWLKTLTQIAGLSGQIPTLLDNHISEGHYLLTQSVNNQKTPANSWSTKHTAFINRLQAGRDQQCSFENSEMHIALTNRSQALYPVVNDSWKQRIRASIQKISNTLGNSNITMVAAQRDFAYWNIRSTTSGIYVFDWEYAADGYIPLYDILHFLIMPRTLRNRFHAQHISNTLQQAHGIGLQLDDNARKSCEPRAQLLAYLVDVCLFYLESNNGLTKGDTVVERYGLLIDELCDIKTT